MIPILSDHLRHAVKAVKERFNASDGGSKDPVSLLVSAQDIVEVCRTLRDEYEFDALMDVTASDSWPELQPRFYVIYQLLSLKQNVREPACPLDGMIFIPPLKDVSAQLV
jgi:NADH:ubiquinone oxidoreductase subunit C